MVLDIFFQHILASIFEKKLRVITANFLSVSKNLKNDVMVFLFFKIQNFRKFTKFFE